MKIKVAFICILLFVACEQEEVSENENTNESICKGCETGSVIDIDGNEYQTVKIGRFWWLAENLRTTTLNDGTPIPEIKESEEWDESEGIAFCWPENNIDYAIPHGALYNGYSVLTNKLCPQGWHVPTTSEWRNLVDIAGGIGVAAKELRASGSESLWDLNYATNANNATGFSAQPTGGRSRDGYFSNLYDDGKWWSSTGLGTIDFNERFSYYFLRIFKSDNDIELQSRYAKGAICVRCIKDYESNRVPTSTSITDKEGNVYKTIKIGNQTWMAENLKTDAGSGSIDHGFNKWNSETFGKLYNYETAKNVCPQGWHLPSDKEWQTLEQNIGVPLEEVLSMDRDNDLIYANKLIADTTLWKEIGYQGNRELNEFGFSALPGGYVNVKSSGKVSSHKDITKNAIFWTSSSSDEYNAIIRELSIDDAIEYDDQDKDDYLSVRCIKDN